MKLASRVILVAVLVISSADLACAQAVTVQQPVVSVFSVDTVVSVPDRGTAYLGGVSTAAEGRGTYGLFPQGSSIGLRRTDTGVQAGVFIHDLEAMDEYLLTRPGSRIRDTWVNPNQRAAAAFDSLREGRVATTSNGRFSDAADLQNERPFARQAPRSHRSGPPQTDDPTELAEFYLAHARDAEQRGSGGVAKMCYRMAARYGSSFAETRLSEMGGE